MYSDSFTLKHLLYIIVWLHKVLCSYANLDRIILKTIPLSHSNSWYMFNFLSRLFSTDPTYMIRAIPSNASDNIYCTLLAHSAVHGAMAGYSGFTVGPVNSRHAYIPISVSLSPPLSVHC